MWALVRPTENLTMRQRLVGRNYFTADAACY